MANFPYLITERETLLLKPDSHSSKPVTKHRLTPAPGQIQPSYHFLADPYLKRTKRIANTQTDINFYIYDYCFIIYDTILFGMVDTLFLF